VGCREEPSPNHGPCEVADGCRWDVPNLTGLIICLWLIGVQKTLRIIESFRLGKTLKNIESNCSTLS